MGFSSSLKLRAVRGGGAGWSGTLLGWGGSRGSCPPYLGLRGSRRYGNAALRRPPGGWGPASPLPCPTGGLEACLLPLPPAAEAEEGEGTGGGSRSAARRGHLPGQTGESGGRCCSRRSRGGGGSFWLGEPKGERQPPCQEAQKEDGKGRERG